MEYKNTWNQPMKDNDQLFRTELREGEMETPGIDEHGGRVSHICDDRIEGGGERK